ncbi:MAG: SDR family NAD(P)-dependent oxidoreductase [Rhodospirillaceae bacterium]|jgi:UDP-glucuronate 4-epimerase|nr:SDR family NAD(P)-dependent oxidoreductase [Rhodospirillales bacterium]MBT3904279.1 SDR family NAD(P)-dependent oxidoreductase [Rhodospirillaceae bacterium]MBT4701087.1 SDR family NAD(P)-dependent oxidoreductase [Rhodospirillaceae bacterium]MBT5033152.1 SDR family NAD(P)-dependent oxidoreductase [Rhodospirillaceae bacterium]MBT6219250.1 SDR family NAD(P)-dependent oxidoreductase [Rhodospirillaceae bacterium]
MTVLVTGAAGFIGYHTCKALLEAGRHVIGIDNLNDYYEVSLKQARLAQLQEAKGFEFTKLDIADRDAVAALVAAHPAVSEVIHLAAQAGVRYSLVNPFAYLHANVEGHLVLLEAARGLKDLKHFVYASSSSVYGDSLELPLAVGDSTDSPKSLYGATKKTMELFSHAYAGLYGLPQTGLRFFTVYGPWGRPDMAPMIFSRKIFANEPIDVFNNGEMARDFTYIDDIVAGVVSCLDKPPSDGVTNPIYNIGNNNAEPLMRFIAILEDALGVKAEINFKPMQPGDVKETYANIDATRRDFGFEPKTSLDEGVPRFVEWYRGYYGV